MRLLSIRVSLPFAAVLFACSAAAQSAAPLTLEQVMADPDWIGAPVEDAWWAWDGQRVQYQRKRDGATIRDTFQQSIDGGVPTMIDGAARADLDASNPVFDARHARMAFARNGDIFVRQLQNGVLRSGALTQVTRSNDDDTLPQWSSDGGLAWRVGNDWYRWTAQGGVVQAALVKAEKAPGVAPKSDDLRERQLRLIDTLRNDKAKRDAARAQEDAWRAADPTRAPTPAYLGDDVTIADSALSPDGRWLLVVTTAKGADAGQAGKLPKYVTESGYEEFEEARVRVGRNAPLPQRLWLVDAAAGKVRELKYDTLPGIKDDPLAALRKAAGKDALNGNRAVRIETDGDGTGPAIHWSDDSRNVAVLVRAVDNKDRWIATVDTANATLQTRDHLHDNAWINWNFNDFGWMPDGKRLWFLSEQSGWSQLYMSDGGKPRQLTSGKWEASSPQLSADGKTFYFVCNRARPGDYEVCAVAADGGVVRDVTAMDGVEGFVLSPDGSKLLVRHSSSYLPPQLA
ncbi:MAG: DPP IV N-terminal domain-containing protein, partial [Luteimonas sp.]